MALDAVISFKWAWKLVTWLPGLFFKRKFSKEWFRQHVIIDLRPRHAPITIWGDEKKEILLWLGLTNLTYFDIELDRLIAELNCAGHLISLTKLDRIDIPSLTVKSDILLRGHITADHLTAISRDIESARRNCHLSIHAEFNSKVHNFKVDVSLDGITPVFHNLNAP